MKESSYIKIAFVGCGGIAQAHLRGIQTHAPQLKVTAAIDINPAQAATIAGQTGAQVFTSFEAALDQGDFDAVDIMLPHNLHEEATTLAFATGKHVVLEKPMSTTLDSCERILAAARQAGTVFMIAEQSQFWPDAVKVQQLILGGALGDIITARALFDERVQVRRKVEATSWRNNKAMTGGGICIDGGLHKLRPLRMWMGDVDEVVAVLAHPLEEMEGESLAHTILRFRSGKLAVFSAILTDTIDAPDEEFRVLGTKGIAVVQKNSDGRTILFNEEFPQGCSVLPEGATRRDAFGLELAEFAQAVLEGAPLTASAEESLGELRIALAMYRSVESHQWEKV